MSSKTIKHNSFIRLSMSGWSVSLWKLELPLLYRLSYNAVIEQLRMGRELFYTARVYLWN